MPTTENKKSAVGDVFGDLAETLGGEDLTAVLGGDDIFADDPDFSKNESDNTKGNTQKKASKSQKAKSQPAKSASSQNGAKAAAKPAAKPKAKKAKAAAKNAKSAASSAKKSAKDAIKDVMSVVEPDAENHIEDEFEEKLEKSKLAPITRPNGMVYRPRPVGGVTDVELLQKARENGIPVLMAGFPGTGKTALAEAAFDGEVITMNGNADMEMADFMGGYVFKAGKEGEAPMPVWQDGPLPRAMKEGKVLFVDDTTLIPANVISVLYPLMDGRNAINNTMNPEEGQIIAKEGFYVCGAHNPGAPGAMLAEALSSRFGIHLTVDSDLVMAQDHFEIDSRIINATAQLRTMRAKGSISWAPEMRELLAFKRNQAVFGTRIAVNNMIGVAPEDARDDVQKRLKEWFPKAEPLTHTE